MKRCVVIMFICALYVGSVFAGASKSSFWYQVITGQANAFDALKDITIGGTKWVQNNSGVLTHQGDNLLDVIKSVTNWVLGILALICLVLVIYGWFLMVTSAGEDDAYNKWWEILKSALIGLAIIGLARYVISGILRLTQKTWWWSVGTTANSDQ